jgi:glutamyl-tRNA synthetase
MVRTRFAPSPTGFLHVGSLRTALYAYAFAKSQNGKLILRVEDTDCQRCIPGATEKIYEMLKIFGIAWDEGPLVGGPYAPYVQSERAKIGVYQKYAEQLLRDGHAYYCCCPPEELEEIEERHECKRIELRDPCRDADLHEAEARIKKGEKLAIRLRVPENEIVSYHDFVLQKEITWKTNFIDEVMLLKTDGFPTYHLGVVVDDALMQISHIIRGRDWLPSTPVHLLLFKYLGFPLPQIGHLTDILDPGGGKLSKRKGSVTCEEFLAEGYLPEAILNFVMLLGWAPKDNRELFTLEEFVQNFQRGRLQVANPIFNRKKLDWFNGMYLRKKTDEELAVLLKKFAPDGANATLINQTAPLIKDRITKLSDYRALAGFFFEEPKTDESLFSVAAPVQLIKALEVLGEVKKWEKLEIENRLQELIKKEGWATGDFFMDFRIAIAGSKITPPITDSIVILGQKTTLTRLQKALEVLKV